MIPYAILSVTLHFKEHRESIRVLDLAPDGFTFRLADPLPEKPDLFEAFFYSFRENRWDVCPVKDFLLEPAEPDEEDPCEAETASFCWQYRILTEDPAFLRRATALASDYENYIRLKLQEEPGELSHRLVGYPAQKEETFAENWELQKAQLFADVKPDRNWSDVLRRHSTSLALSLDTPWACERFLRSDSPEDHYRKWIRENHLDDHPLAEFLPDAICVGNSFCPSLFPSADQLKQLWDDHRFTGSVTVLVLPPVPEGLMVSFSETFPLIAAGPIEEIVVNDWGTAALLSRGYPGRFHLTAGELLVKRRKDPRLPWKNGCTSPGSDPLLAENSFNAGFFTEELRKRYQLTGCRNEACGYEYRLPQGMENDLILPFYQTNTAGFCTLKATCENGLRGRQDAAHTTRCAHYCKDRCFLYPSFLGTAGIGNSLFAFDRRIMTDSRYLDSFLSQGVRRILLRIP